MSNPQGKHISLWKDTMERPELGDTSFRPLPADVVVIGAGVTGLTTAVLLQEAGKQVAIVDAGTFGECVTTHSTVKVTTGHGTLYSKIEKTRGLEAAKAYADANTAGLQAVLDLADRYGIDCMLEHGHPHVIYAEKPDEVQKVEKEADIASQVGLPVTLTRDVPLPFAVAQALSFDSQAHFHPGQYVAGLAAAFVAAGGTIMGGVRATDVDDSGESCEIETDAGTLRADYVVVATQYPFLNRGGQFTQLKSRRTYGIAAVLPRGTTAGMTINVGEPTHSTRSVKMNGEELLVVVGAGHEVGHITDTAERWVQLQDWAREKFGVSEFRYHWSAEEVSTLDGVPFVGEIAPGSPRVLTATGFDGWGMTNGTAAAMMMRDIVTDVDNPWLPTFNAARAETSPSPLTEFAKHNVHVAKTWLKDRVGGSPDGDPTELRPGDAAILEVDGEQTAAYRDDSGRLHAVSAICTHMKCTVEWNAGETSWDCPCHGSRFTHDGAVLHGPASTPLAKRDVGT